MRLSRRGLLAGFAAAPLSAPRPNIVLMLADGLPAWVLGCYGNRDFRTPHIDRLARMGTRFTNHFACTTDSQLCRATYLTGIVARRQDGEVMLSDLLSRAGYQCGFAGIWNLGNGTRPGHGFDFTYTLEGGGSRYQDPVMFLNGERVEEEGYLARHITRRAVEFLDRQSGASPFFLVVSHQNPQRPFEGHPLRYYDLYKDATGPLQGAPGVTALDDQIPPVLNKLREKKLDGNTLIVFAGVAGSPLGPRDPGNMFEESIRLPMIWQWPGKVPVESVRPELVSVYDLFPTLTELLGLKSPDPGKLCGRSYLRPATGKPYAGPEKWDNPVFGYSGETAMARDFRYKLVLRNSGKGPNELYDLRLDSGEANNQYDNATLAVARDRLATSLAEWRKRYS